VVTKLDIWNAALALLPHDRRIASESEQSVERERCAEHWDAARRAVLTAREWGWLVRSEPACCGAAHTGGWFAQRPMGALLVLGFWDSMGNRVGSEPLNGGFRVRGPAREVRYLMDEEDPEMWPYAVRDAVAAELAARIAPVMTDNPARTQELRISAMARLEEAGRQDAQETATDGGDPFVFVHARR
jgi:hypothetical protein